MTTPNPYDEEPPPPILGSWKAMYIFVLVLHAIIITLFYIITEVYS